MLKRLFKKPIPKSYEIGEQVHGGFYLGFIESIQSHLIISDKNNQKLNFTDSFKNVVNKFRHSDWELPTICELNLMYENFKTFNQANFDQRIDRNVYLSYSIRNNMVLAKDFKTGKNELIEQDEQVSIRLIKVIH